MSPATETPDNNAFLQQYMENHISVWTDGAYSLCFPWREDHPPLPSNYTICSKQTRPLTHQLAKTPELLKTYGEINKEQGLHWKQQSGTQHTLHPSSPSQKDSATTPIRIVYDCSCKQSRNSPSLNDCLNAGHFLTRLCTIVHFWLHPAFFHVYLDESDRDSTRFMAIRS